MISPINPNYCYYTNSFGEKQVEEANLQPVEENFEAIDGASILLGLVLVVVGVVCIAVAAFIAFIIDQINEQQNGGGAVGGVGGGNANHNLGGLGNNNHLLNDQNDPQVQAAIARSQAAYTETVQKENDLRFKHAQKRTGGLDVTLLQTNLTDIYRQIELNPNSPEFEWIPEKDGKSKQAIFKEMLEDSDPLAMEFLGRWILLLYLQGSLKDNDLPLFFKSRGKIEEPKNNFFRALYLLKEQFYGRRDSCIIRWDAQKSELIEIEHPEKIPPDARKISQNQQQTIISNFLRGLGTKEPAFNDWIVPIENMFGKPISLAQRFWQSATGIVNGPVMFGNPNFNATFSAAVDGWLKEQNK